MELFKIGFLSFTLLDLADVALITLMFYKLYQYIKGTVGLPIFVGLLFILAGSAAASFLSLSTLDWIFSKLTSVWLIVVVILFQPELRRLLLFLGQSRVFGNIFKNDNETIINEVALAVDELADKHVGALLVFVRNVGLKSYLETGQPLDALISKKLLVSIFAPNTPLHDGAAILSGKKIQAARCVLPLTQNETISENFGMRHRAALGISEVSDAFVVVVSEESGKISIAEDGKLVRGLSLAELRARLVKALK
jgi:diadenylate cyclase